MTWDYAQTFFKSDDKEKSRESGIKSGSVRVRQVAVKAPVVQASQTNNKGPDLHNISRRNQRPQLIKPPPYAPSQGGSWESIVKLFKNALRRVIAETRRKPLLIKLQTFVSDAVRIVNDRTLTSVSSHPNDVFYFSFLFSRSVACSECPH